MKLTIILFMLLTLCEQSSAQSDTLQIRLKSGKLENIAVQEIQSVRFENVTSVVAFSFKQNEANNFPNPFSEETAIDFEIESAGTVEVTIYDYIGTFIRLLTCENCAIGRNQLKWDTKNYKGEQVPSGVYYFVIRTNNKTYTKQMIKIK